MSTTTTNTAATWVPLTSIPVTKATNTITNINTTGGTTITVNGVSLQNNSTTWTTVNLSKTKYHILGEDIEFDVYYDPQLAMALSLINFNGYKFYFELCKNSVNFPMVVKDYIEQRIKILSREDNIDKIIGE